MMHPEGSTPRLDVIGLAKEMVRRLPASDPLYDLALDTAIADDQVQSFGRTGHTTAAQNWAAHRDGLATDLLTQLVGSGRPRELAPRTTTVDDLAMRGCVDAIRRAHGIAARDLGPEHAELLTWLQRARDCAEAA